MASSLKSFRHRYEAMDTNNLTELYCDGGLTNEAELILADVLRERGIVPEELLLEIENEAKKEQYKKDEEERNKEIENESVSLFDLQRMEETKRIDSEKREDNSNKPSSGINGFGFTIFAFSIMWCVFLLLRTKSFPGQKIIVFSGSNLFDIEGITVSENGYLGLWLVGVLGICSGLWMLYTSFMKKSITAKEQSTNAGLMPATQIKVSGYSGMALAHSRRPSMAGSEASAANHIV